MTYDELLAALASGGAGVNAAGPAADGEIAAAQAELGVVFPPDYTRFLRTLGALDVAPREVFGVERPGGASVVASSREWRGAQGVPAAAVVVEVDGLEGDPVGFVCAGDPAGEPPIVRWEDGRAVTIATRFADYLADVAEPVIPRPGEAAGAPVFDPPWGQARRGGAVSPDRKEVKVAGTIVQRVKYDGASLAAVARELNRRRVAARQLGEWTVPAVREVFEAWKSRY